MQTELKAQPLNGFLIVRMLDGERRVVGTAFSERDAQGKVASLEHALNHTGATYSFERNPKAAKKNAR